jgi:hypothetical protein
MRNDRCPVERSTLAAEHMRRHRERKRYGNVVQSHRLSRFLECDFTPDFGRMVATQRTTALGH